MLVNTFATLVQAFTSYLVILFAKMYRVLFDQPRCLLSPSSFMAVEVYR